MRAGVAWRGERREWAAGCSEVGGSVELSGELCFLAFPLSNKTASHILEGSINFFAIGVIFERGTIFLVFICKY